LLHSIITFDLRTERSSAREGSRPSGVTGDQACCSEYVFRVHSKNSAGSPSVALAHNIPSRSRCLAESYG
jgi:hypothetical protein